MPSNATANKTCYQIPFPSHPDASSEKPYSSFGYPFQMEPSYPESEDNEEYMNYLLTLRSNMKPMAWFAI
jgi:hypothetical protein